MWRRGFKAMVLAIGLCTLSAGAHAETGKWLRAESPHFILYSDNSAKITDSYLMRLEQYRYLLARFHGQTQADEADTPKLHIYFLNDHHDLLQTWPKAASNVQGYFKNCVEGQAAFGIYQDDFDSSKTSKVQDQEENTSQVILFHEYAHYFMFQTSSLKYPKWFVEGFAEYFSTIKFQNDQVIIGMESRMRAYALNSHNLVGYDKILRSDNAKGVNGEPIESFYPQAWLLTHYILSSPERAKAFQVYLTAYDKGEDPVTAFETAFGIKMKDLERALYSYQDKLTATIYQIKDMPTPQIETTSVPVSGNKLLLWDAADRICPGKEFSPILLGEIRTEAARFPADDYAQMTLARAEITIGDESKALDYLLKYTTDHPDDGDTRFMLGQTWFLMTVHGHILSTETRESQMAKARAALGQAYKLDPLNATNLYYYSLALDNHAETPSDNMINAAIAAHNLAPAVDAYAIRAAVLLIRKDRADEAADMLYPLANNPHNELSSRWASNIITAIQNKAPREELLKLLRTPVVVSKTDDKAAKP